MRIFQHEEKKINEIKKRKCGIHVSEKIWYASKNPNLELMFCLLVCLSHLCACKSFAIYSTLSFSQY